MSVLQGIQTRKQSRKVSKGILARGNADADLRRIESAELFGQMLVTEDANQVSGQTGIDLRKQAMHFEGLDTARILYKAALEAYNVRREGDAAFMSGVNQTINQAFSAIQFGMAYGRYSSAQEALALAQADSAALNSAMQFDMTTGLDNQLTGLAGPALDQQVGLLQSRASGRVRNLTAAERRAYGVP